MDDRLDKRKELMKQFFTIVSGYNTSAMLDEIQTLQAQLDAVRALPNEFEANARKVRDGCAGSRPWAKGKATGLRHAAILLEAKLKEAGDE